MLHSLWTGSAMAGSSLHGLAEDTTDSLMWGRGGQFYHSGDIWQWLEMGVEWGVLLRLVGEARDADKHSAMHRTAPHNTE